MLPILLSIFAYDVWFYISHLLLHTKSLYRFHKAHHKKIYPTFIDTYVGHPFETLFQGVGMFVPYAFYTYSTTDTIIILCFLNIRGMMRHDKRGTWLVGNHHLLHHQYAQYNYGEVWLDYLGGTLIRK